MENLKTRTDCSIDLETFSSVDIKNGVYAYTNSPDFEILLVGYKFSDEDEVTVIDMLNEDPGAHKRFWDSLEDPSVVKTAYNAAFERQCLSCYLGRQLSADNWRCTMILASQLGLPRSLADVGEALGLAKEDQKLKTGAALIQYFCKPCKPTKANGYRVRNMPEHSPERWKLFKEYNAQDVHTEQTILDLLRKFKPDAKEQKLWTLDQEINDRGVLLDVDMAEKVVRYSTKRTDELMREAQIRTGLDNPNSLQQLKTWLAGQDIKVDTLTKGDVSELLSDDLPDNVRRVLEIRQSLGKTSLNKYQTMLDVACDDGRARGIMQFYGGHTGRWAGRSLQPQNLTRNTMPDDMLDAARTFVKADDFESLELVFDDPSDVLSQLVRTAFIPSPGNRFVVTDFSAIEARVVAWAANETWRLDVFRNGGDIYCESASRIYHKPVVKHGINGELRQKGKVAELACAYGGGVGAMKAMDPSGAVPEEEMDGIIRQWRAESPKIVKFWGAVQDAAIAVINGEVAVKRLTNFRNITFRLATVAGTKVLRIYLPNGRPISYWDPKVLDGEKGPRITYMSQNQTTRKWERTDTWGGKLVENCLAGDTLVLTDSGWRYIDRIGVNDRLWDGIEWVGHQGLLYKGEQTTIEVDGVRMTPDHEILTEGGWLRAEACEGHNRRAARVPDRYRIRRLEREKITLAGAVRLRCGKDTDEQGLLEKPVLRLHEKETHRRSPENARTVEAPDVACLALDEGALHLPDSAGVEELRRERNNGLRTLARKLRKLLGGHVPDISEGPDTRQNRRKRELLPGELPLGDVQSAEPKQEKQSDYRYPLRTNDRCRSGGSVGNRENNIVLSAGSSRAERLTVRTTERKEPVYDIQNAGPRHRFVVLGNHGPLIVHNCIQSIARDCLAEKMTQLEGMGYPIVFHVHDEMILDIPRSDTAAAEIVDRVMAEPLDWAPELPLKGGTYECDFYRKD